MRFSWKSLPRQGASCCSLTCFLLRGNARAAAVCHAASRSGDDGSERDGRGGWAGGGRGEEKAGSYALPGSCFRECQLEYAWEGKAPPRLLTSKGYESKVGPPREPEVKGTN